MEKFSTKRAFQDLYSDQMSHCYGCGRLNEQGLQIKSYWAENGEETVCEVQPRPYHTAVRGYVYGGLIASVIDCHSTGTAAAAMYKHQNRPMDSDPELRFLTASLHVDYLQPTPIDHPLKIRSQIDEVKRRKVVIRSQLFSGDLLCAKGEVVAVQVPEDMFQQIMGNN